MPANKLKTLFSTVKRRHQWLTIGTQYNALPAEVRNSIQNLQDSSEILIGWIQLVVLVAFAMLYFIAPKTIPSAEVFEPVPVFLGLYFAFTCLRLYLSYRISLPYWILIVSIIVDMGLLFGLIWTFHVQYMQPPSFYLKAPTLLYIFIFITLRALRFEPGFVLFSGIVAAGGWLLMVLYAVTRDHGLSTITRDYVEYLTSNSVLLGGEFDKIISIILVTLIMTLAIARGRGLLIQSIVDASAVRNLSRFVPDSIAAKVASAEGSLISQKSETREATVLFVDLESFTSIGERLEPGQLIDTLNEYFSVVSAPIEAFNGVINQFQGDAVLASFNLPKADPNHAGNAVNAALAIANNIQRHQFSAGIDLRVRIGINTGNVVGGFVGTPDRLSYTVHGDAVNIAARLEQLNKSYETRILVAESTQNLVFDDSIEFKHRGKEILRGRHGEICFSEPLKQFNR